MGAHDVQQGVLSPERIAEIQNENRQRPFKIASGAGLLGLEDEIFIVDKNDYSAGNSRPIVEILREENIDVSHEIGGSQIEIHPGPQPFTPEGLETLAMEFARRHERVANVAEEFGYRVFRGGALPNAGARGLAEVTHDTIHNPRYEALIQTFEDWRGGEYIVPIRQADGSMLNLSGGLRTAGLITSVHVNYSAANMDKYLAVQRRIAAPLLAVTANAQYLDGQKAQRQSIKFEVFEGLAYCPHRDDRCGVVGHDSVEGHVRDILSHAPIFDDDDPKKRYELHNGTVWHWVRPKGGWEGDTFVFDRQEVRWMDAQPTFYENLSASVFVVGASMGGLPKILQGLREEQIEENFYNAAKDGLNAVLHTKGGTMDAVNAAEILLFHARQNLVANGFSLDAAEKWLKPMRLRLDNEENPAMKFNRMVENHGYKGALEDYTAHEGTNTPYIGGSL